MLIHVVQLTINSYGTEMSRPLKAFMDINAAHKYADSLNSSSEGESSYGEVYGIELDSGGVE